MEDGRIGCDDRDGLAIRGFDVLFGEAGVCTYAPGGKGINQGVVKQ